MFRWLPLVWANLTRRKLRLIFTFISILIAFLLFGVLDALRTSLADSVNLAGADRLIMRSKVNLTTPLPLAHFTKVKAVPGVRAVASLNWFGGEYRNPREQIQVQATQPEAFLQVYPDFVLTPEEIEAWKRDRQGIVVGRLLAQQYGWKLGQRIPLRSQIWRKQDNTDVWQFNIVGIYDVKGAAWNARGAFFQYDYFNESLLFGQDTVGTLGIRVDDARRSGEIAEKLDALFENSPFETETSTESEWIKGLLEQIGNIGMILVSVTTAVFFTMLLVTANTMAQSVRERTSEIGVLKTLGFSNTSILTLVLIEALTLTITGGLAGLGLAYLLTLGLGPAIKDYFPAFVVGGGTFLVGLVLMVAFGLVSGLWPSLMAMRLKVVDALRRI
jgi:putative ABC transport system permease protein